MNDWKETCFSKFVEVNPKVNIVKNQDTSFVEMADLNRGNKYAESSFKKAYRNSGTKFQDRDTLFARITPCLENGKICQVRNLLNGVGFGSTEFFVFRGKDEYSDTDFIYYLSKWQEVREFAEANFNGTSGRQRVPKESFNNLFLKLPPLPEQKAIAGVLSSLDDKIDLLHRQNKTLEAIAEALWRKMFIEDADPGWKKVKISDIFDVRDGTHDSPKQSKHGFHLITSRHLQDEGIDFANAYKISEEDYIKINKRSKVDKNDVLFSMIGTLGLIHYVDYNPNYAIKNIGLFKSSMKPEFAKYLYLLMKSPIGRDFIFTNTEGSTQEYIALGSLRSLIFSYPGDEIILKFDKIIEPVFIHIFNNKTQIRALSSLRDTLLPKLMSGEVRVKE